MLSIVPRSLYPVACLEDGEGLGAHCDATGLERNGMGSAEGVGECGGVPLSIFLTADDIDCHLVMENHAPSQRTAEVSPSEAFMAPTRHLGKCLSASTLAIMGCTEWLSCRDGVLLD